MESNSTPFDLLVSNRPIQVSGAPAHSVSWDATTLTNDTLYVGSYENSPNRKIMAFVGNGSEALKLLGMPYIDRDGIRAITASRAQKAKPREQVLRFGSVLRGEEYAVRVESYGRHTYTAHGYMPQTMLASVTADFPSSVDAGKPINQNALAIAMYESLCRQNLPITVVFQDGSGAQKTFDEVMAMKAALTIDTPLPAGDVGSILFVEQPMEVLGCLGTSRVCVPNYFNVYLSPELTRDGARVEMKAIGEPSNGDGATLQQLEYAYMGLEHPANVYRLYEEMPNPAYFQHEADPKAYYHSITIEYENVVTGGWLEYRNPKRVVIAIRDSETSGSGMAFSDVETLRSTLASMLM